MPKNYVLFLSIVALPMLLLPAMADAVQVSHHGRMVDTNGSVRYCLACHDGAISINVAVCTVNCGAAINSIHSVLMPYPTRGSKSGKFRPLFTVPRTIRLAEGNVVTCVSCHDMRNKAKSHLVMDNKDSALCLSCHLK